MNFNPVVPSTWQPTVQSSSAVDICAGSTTGRKQGSLVEMGGEDSGGAPVKKKTYVYIYIYIYIYTHTCKLRYSLHFKRLWCN